eukprot:Skav201093  [mRNA]  locus=scaffold2562:148539:150897:+ [translate_table: standard]
MCRIGFDCIKLIWGDAWNELVDNDHDGKLIEVLERTPDGDCQRYAAKQATGRCAEAGDPWVVGEIREYGMEVWLSGW